MLYPFLPTDWSSRNVRKQGRSCHQNGVLRHFALFRYRCELVSSPSPSPLCFSDFLFVLFSTSPPVTPTSPKGTLTTGPSLQACDSRKERRSRLTSSSSFLSLVQPLAAHADLPSLRRSSVILWAGDFNYRIDLSNEDARELALNDNLTHLIGADQVRPPFSLFRMSSLSLKSSRDFLFAAYESHG